MIDTVLFSIHNLRKYKDLVQTIYSKRILHEDILSGTYRKSTYLKNDIIDKRFVLNLHELHSTGAVNYTCHKTLHITSSEYDITIFISERKDKIEINFSLPKLIYGSNVIQSVKPAYASGFQLEWYKHPENQVLYNFSLLKRCIKFFEYIFDHKLNFTDITIDRIDLCFNIICDDEYQKKLLFHKLKEIKKPYENEHNSLNPYKNSLVYVSQDYSYKFYDKGEEFGKTSNIKKCKKIANKFHNFNFTDELRENFLSYSKRILRFEVTYRCRRISLLSLKRYGEKSKLDIGRWHYQQDIKSKYKDYYKLMKEKSFDFYLDLNPEESYNYRTCNNYHEKNNKIYLDHYAIFDETMFHILFDDFSRILNHFRSQPMPEICTLEQKIDIYNTMQSKTLIPAHTDEVICDEGTFHKTHFQKIKPAISKTNLIKYFKLMDAGFSLKKLFDDKMISQATYYRMKKHFENVGMTHNDQYLNISFDFDYLRYYFSEGGINNSFTMQKLINL